MFIHTCVYNMYIYIYIHVIYMYVHTHIPTGGLGREEARRPEGRAAQDYNDTHNSNND